jgi:hypothetical protein
MATIGDITTRTAINAYLKYLQKKIVDQFNDATVLMNTVKRRTGREVAGGRQVELPMWIYPNQQLAGTRGDAGTWSKASVGKRAYALLEVYNHNTTGGIGHLAELKTKRDLQSLQSVTEATVQDIQTGFPMSLNGLLFLDGRGVLARVSSTDLPNLKFKVHDELNAGSNATWGTRYLKEGLWIEATDDKTDTDPARSVNAQVIDVNTSTRDITCEGNLTGLVQNDYILLQDGLNNVSQGLCSAVSDGSTAPDFASTYLNIDRTATGNSYFQANVVNLGGAGTIEDEMIEIMTTVEKSAGKAPKMCITTHEVYNNIFFQSKSSQGRQFVVSVGKSDGRRYALGFDAITVGTPYGAIEIFGEKDCPAATMFLIDPADFLFGQLNEPGWYKTPDGSMFHEVGGTYGLQVNWYWVMNFVCRLPRAQARLSEVPVA